jgi:RNA polymerase-binding transcription factor DksA
MPSRSEKKPSDTTPAPKKRKRRSWPKGGPTKAEVKKFHEALLEQRAEIIRSSRGLEGEALKSSGQDFSVDHMADHGTDNFEQDIALSLLQGGTRLFREIQRALEKTAGEGNLPYGLCEACAEEQPPEGDENRCPTCPWIPKGRLEAVPYARLCVVQQELAEEGGA